MRLRLLAHTPDVEELIATAALTTASRRTPHEIYERLRERADKVEKVLRGIILKHGTVLEHNRLVFLAEADEREMLSTLLANRFFEATRLGEGRWLLSCSLRTALSVLMSDADVPEGLREGLSEALGEVAPTIWRRVSGGGS